MIVTLQMGTFNLYRKIESLEDGYRAMFKGTMTGLEGHHLFTDNYYTSSEV